MSLLTGLASTIPKVPGAIVGTETGLPGLGSLITSGLEGQPAGKVLGASTSTPYYGPSNGAANGGTYSGNGGSGGAAPAVNNSAILAQYDQGIGNVNSAMGRLPGQEDVGNQNIQTAYNAAVNNLNQSKATGQQTYDTNTNQNRQDYVTNKNSINANTGNSLNSLMRLLAAHGAAGSSASINASQAAARQGTLQRTGAGEAFGHNQSALDTNWNNFLGSWNNSLTDVGNQRTNQQNQLHGSIESTRAGLLQSLATLMGQRAGAAGGNAVGAAQPYLDQANAALSHVDQLGRNVPVFNVAPTAYNAPTLDHYTANPNAAPTATNNGAAGDYASPFLSLLLGKKQNNQASAF